MLREGIPSFEENPAQIVPVSIFSVFVLRLPNSSYAS